MGVNSQEAVGQTAVIYQFPLQRRRLPVEAVRNEMSKPVLTGSWYHDEAIEDAKRGH